MLDKEQSICVMTTLGNLRGWTGQKSEYLATENYLALEGRHESEKKKSRDKEKGKP